MEATTTAYQVALPYNKSDLEPVVSKDALAFHYDVLHRNYVDKARAGEGGEFNIAGAVLHNRYFEQLSSPVTNNTPTGKSSDLLSDFLKFKQDFTDAALSLRGSGWVYINTSGHIKTIHNHEMRDDIAMIVDLWEHAWVLDYKSKEEYLNNTWRIINWNIVNDRL